MPKILDLGFSETKSLYTHPDRRLNWNVLLYISAGEMEVWEEETEYILREGQYLFLKNGLHHFGEPKTQAFTKWYWIHFYDCSINDTCEELSLWDNAFKKLELSREDYNKFVKLPKQGKIRQPKAFEKNLNMLIEIYNSMSPFRSINLSIETFQLLLSIYKESVGEYKYTKSDNTVKKIIQYIENKESYNLDSSELESCLDMNYSYLCNIFKYKTGHTIHSYNSQIFIYKAVNIMRSTNMNISEISDKLGFSNQFYFNRVFRRVMDCSPSEYLNQIYRSE
jgi:AraC-like DNA-binding protein